MSLLAVGLQPQFAYGLHAVSGQIKRVSIADLLVSRTAAYSLTCNAASQSINFDFRSPTDILGAVASDCNRLATACFQTAKGLDELFLNKDDMPWSLVKLYYASFYAGHFILRALGQSCSFLDARHAARVNQYATAAGINIPFRFDAGLYNIELSPRATMFLCTKLQSQSSHDAFWSLFSIRWRQIAQAVLRGPLVPEEAQAIFAQIDAFDRLMLRQRSYSWLSTFRNDIQYRQKFDVWHPSGVTKRDREAIARLAGLWKLDPMSIDLSPTRLGTISDFVLCCCFMISVCRAVVTRLVALEKLTNRSFARYGPLLYLNGV